MRILKRLTVAAVALTPLLTLATPAQAAGRAHVSFRGDIRLWTVPCPGGPDCIANFRASLAVGEATTTGPGYSVITDLSATVNYSQLCTAEMLLFGSARGTATLSGTNVVGTALPMTVPFEWTRVGTTALIISSPSTNTSPAVIGTAEFIPSRTACAGGSLDASIVGTVTVITTA